MFCKIPSPHPTERQRPRPWANRFFPLRLAAGLALAAALFSTPAVAQDPAPVPGSWTLLHLPDMQNYVNDATRTEILFDQMRWIHENRSARQMRFALQVGDLVNDNNATQWARSRAAFDLLAGELPFALCTGNHDCGPGGSGDTRATLFTGNAYFGATTPYAMQPSVGGFFQHPDDPPGNTQNAWHTFRAGGQDFLVLTCEWGPRDKVVTWMDGIVAAHPYHRAILVCHAYLSSGTARYDWSQSTSSMNPHSFGIGEDPDGTNDGQELWDKLVSRHENFCLVSCGHAGRGFRTVQGARGNKVHEMLYNTQELPDGGNGWIRLLEFLPDGRTVQARTYSPHLGQWDTSTAASFRFTLSEVSTTDLDSDGLPDYYEQRHGWPLQSPDNAAQDADGDGHTNLQEYLAATRPDDPTSGLNVEDVDLSAAGQITLTWTSVPGIQYQIEQADTPNPATGWTAAGSPVTAESEVTQAIRAVTGNRRFLRVAVVPASS